jgi:hypothetical protein
MDMLSSIQDGSFAAFAADVATHPALKSGAGLEGALVYANILEKRVASILSVQQSNHIFPKKSTRFLVSSDERDVLYKNSVDNPANEYFRVPFAARGYLGVPDDTKIKVVVKVIDQERVVTTSLFFVGNYVYPSQCLLEMTDAATCQLFYEFANARSLLVEGAEPLSDASKLDPKKPVLFSLLETWCLNPIGLRDRHVYLVRLRTLGSALQRLRLAMGVENAMPANGSQLNVVLPLLESSAHGFLYYNCRICPNAFKCPRGDLQLFPPLSDVDNPVHVDGEEGEAEQADDEPAGLRLGARVVGEPALQESEAGGGVEVDAGIAAVSEADRGCDVVDSDADFEPAQDSDRMFDFAISTVDSSNASPHNHKTLKRKRQELSTKLLNLMPMHQVRRMV